MNWKSASQLAGFGSRRCWSGLACFTRRRVRVVLGEGHVRFEIATVIKRVRVDDHESDVPRQNVVLCKLDSGKH